MTPKGTIFNEVAIKHFILYSFHQFDDNTCVEEFQPLSKKALKKAKLRRMKEIKSSQVIKEVLLYLLFLFLLLVVAYSHRDSAAYEMTVNLENHFSISVRVLFL